MKGLVIPAVLVVLMFVFLAGSCRTVPPGHRGVVVTMGKVSQDLRGEGVTFVTPFLARVQRCSIQQQTERSNAACFSSDLQTMVVTYNVLFRVPESKVIELYQQYRGEPFTALIDPRMQEVVKQSTARYRAEDAVKNRDKIKADVESAIRLAVGDIIDIRDVVIANIDLTEELEKAIESKQVEEQRALAKQYELQREQKEAEITIVKAKAEADAVRVKGEALKLAPDVIALEIAKKWNGVAPLVVNGTGANILLPLGGTKQQQ